jgi:hypothetical protein
MEAKFTKGKWLQTKGTFETDLFMVSSEFGVICDIRKSLPLNEQQANALLIVEAGNIRQQIPFSLTELKRQRDEMLEMLEKCEYFIRASNQYSELGKKVEQLIKEATQI